MESAVLVALWIGVIASLVGTWIACTMLIFKLREGRPDIYAKIGSPSALSRGAEFLWSLRAYEADLGPELRKLRRVSLIFLLSFVAFGLIFVSIIIGSAFSAN